MTGPKAVGPKEGLATIREAQEFLAVSRGTVYSLMAANHLGFVKIGAARRIPWAAIYALIERNTSAI